MLYLDLPGEDIAVYRKQGFEPVQLKADNMISDSSGEWQPGFWVMTTPLKQLHDDCIFETRNSLYVMVGPGSQKKIDPDLAQSFFV